MKRQHLVVLWLWWLRFGVFPVLSLLSLCPPTFTPTQALFSAALIKKPLQPCLLSSALLSHSHSHSKKSKLYLTFYFFNLNFNYQNNYVKFHSQKLRNRPCAVYFSAQNLHFLVPKRLVWLITLPFVTILLPACPSLLQHLTNIEIL